MRVEPRPSLSSFRSSEPVVLFVDDEPEVLSAIRRCFRHEPYIIFTALGPREALEWIERRPIDLVIADERMPEMAGTELLRAVRDQSPRTARGILTGYPSEIIIQQGLEAGAEAFLYKPWDEQALRKTVRSLLLKGSTERAHTDQDANSPEGSFDLGGEV
jgi:response regulator RpfG family c-di-GMP phosphodiesterase